MEKIHCQLLWLLTVYCDCLLCLSPVPYSVSLPVVYGFLSDCLWPCLFACLFAPSLCPFSFPVSLPFHFPFLLPFPASLLPINKQIAKCWLFLCIWQQKKRETNINIYCIYKYKYIYGIWFIGISAFLAHKQIPFDGFSGLPLFYCIFLCCCCCCCCLADNWIWHRLGMSRRNWRIYSHRLCSLDWDGELSLLAHAKWLHDLGLVSMFRFALWFSLRGETQKVARVESSGK